MTAPFTPEQEARLREIFREELGSQTQTIDRILTRVAKGGLRMKVETIGSVSVAEISGPEITFTPISERKAAASPTRTKRIGWGAA